MGKHTSGPWQQRDDQTNEGWITIIGNVDSEYMGGPVITTYDVIARCEDEFGERLPNVSANAARIVKCVNACEGLADPSVVPELVKALEWIDKNPFASPYNMIAVARAALAKAKGERAK